MVSAEREIWIICGDLVIASPETITSCLEGGLRVPQVYQCGGASDQCDVCIVFVFLGFSVFIKNNKCLIPRLNRTCRMEEHAFQSRYQVGVLTVYRARPCLSHCR